MTYVRRATSADTRELLAMARAFHQESPVFAPMAFDNAKVLHLIGETLFNPDWLPLVAVDDHGICGMSLVFCAETFFGNSRECMDLAFYVLPQRRGSRAASLMLDRIIEWATERGACRLTIAPRTGIRDEAVGRFFAKKQLEVGGTMWTTALPF